MKRESGASRPPSGGPPSRGLRPRLPRHHAGGVGAGGHHDRHRVGAETAAREAHTGLPGRVLDPEHFEFRHGGTAAGGVASAETPRDGQAPTVRRLAGRVQKCKRKWRSCGIDTLQPGTRTTGYSRLPARWSSIQNRKA